MLTTNVKLLDKRLAEQGTYATAASAGIDMRACWVEPLNASRLVLGAANGSYTIYPGESVKVGSGIAIHLESTVLVDEEDGGRDPVCGDFISTAGLLLPRSGLGTKHGIRLSNTIGLIDADYQGEVIMALHNAGNDPFTFSALERLAQLVVFPVYRIAYNVVEEFAASERGEGGFGSTGQG